MAYYKGRKRHGRGLKQNNDVGPYRGAAGAVAKAVILNEVYKATKPFREAAQRNHYLEQMTYPRAPYAPNAPGRPRYPGRPRSRAPPGPPPPAPSRAFARPKRRIIQQTVGNSTTILSNSMMYNRFKGRKAPAFMDKNVAGVCNTMLRTDTFIMKSSVGRQVHFTHALLDMDRNLMAVTDSTKEINQMFHIANEANPATLNTNVSDVKKLRLYVGQMRVNYKMVNTTNQPIRVIVRVLSPKQATDYDPVVVWGQCAKLEDNADTNAATTQGFAPYNHVMDPLAPDASPQQVYGFRRRWNIESSRYIKLDAGQEHAVNLHVLYNKKMLASDLFMPGYQDEALTTDLDPIALNRQYQPPWTKFVMFSVLGPKAQTTDDIMTYNEGQLSVYYTSSIKFWYYPVRFASKYIINTVTTTPLPAQLYAMDNEDANENEAAARTI